MGPEQSFGFTGSHQDLIGAKMKSGLAVQMETDVCLEGLA